MQIFLSPELINDNVQLLNIVNQKNDAVGYVSFIKNETKMYVFGHLEEEGVCEDYKDIIKPYIKGMKKADQNIEAYCYVSVGGKTIELKEDDEQQN